MYPVLFEAEEVAVASTQFGFDYYENHLDELRNRLAIECFYGGEAVRNVCRRFGSFHAWAREYVPSFKDQSGLVRYFQVDSVEEGREVWAAWKEAHRKH